MILYFIDYRAGWAPPRDRRRAAMNYLFPRFAGARRTIIFTTGNYGNNNVITVSPCLFGFRIVRRNKRNIIRCFRRVPEDVLAAVVVTIIVWNRCGTGMRVARQMSEHARTQHIIIPHSCYRIRAYYTGNSSRRTPKTTTARDRKEIKNKKIQNIYIKKTITVIA